MRTDFEGAVQAVRIASNFDWTWTPQDLSLLCAKTGWRVAQTRDHGAMLETGLQVRRPIATFSVDQGGLSAIGQEYQTVRATVVVISDPFDKNDPDQTGVAVEQFVEASGILVDVLGGPAILRTGGSPSMAWRLSNVVVALSFGNSFLALHLRNPKYQEWIDSHSGSENQEDCELFRENVDRLLSAWQGGWVEFSDILAEMLSEMPVCAELAFEASGGRYVRFMYEKSGIESRTLRLWVELSRNTEMTAEYRLPGSDLEILEQQGWTRPIHRRHDNWARCMEWPARRDEFKELARSVVSVMRDDFHIVEPAGLTARIEYEDLNQ